MKNKVVANMYTGIIFVTLLLASPLVSMTGNVWVDRALVPIGFYVLGLFGVCFDACRQG